MEENNIYSRSKLHELALQIMYSFLISQDLNKEIDFKAVVSDITHQNYDDIDIFLKELLIKSLKYEKETIEYCEKFLNKWKFNRLNYCAQAILILSITNYFYIKNDDKAVIINVAVKLAKKYGNEKDYKFINGILDNCLNDRN